MYFFFQIPKVLHNSQSNDTKNRKNVRRKNKNLLQDIANVENSLAKARDNIEEGNIYRQVLIV